jgi:large subunit ribosomal protein L31
VARRLLQRPGGAEDQIETASMKKDIHPNYHPSAVMTDGTGDETRSTYGRRETPSLDIDPKTHPAQLAGLHLIDRGGRLSKFKSKFDTFSSRIQRIERRFALPPVPTPCLRHAVASTLPQPPEPHADRIVQHLGLTARAAHRCARRASCSSSGD